MSLPKFPQTSVMERIGVSHVASILAEMGLVFRETSNSDTGIDGYIEEINNDSEVTGRLLAVQIKSGSSCLHDKGDYFVFYADESHMKYWKLYPIPVLLFVFLPETDLVYFQSIKSHSDVFSTKILIPKTQILSAENRDTVFANLAGFSSKYHTIQELYGIMDDTRITAGDSYVSFMDMFVGGLTNLCSDLFCDMSVLTNLIDVRAKFPWICVGVEEHEFLWEFIKFITKENLAKVNFDSCLLNWEERRMTPRILVPLTFRGIEYCKYVESKHPGSVCETFVSIKTDPCWDERIERLEIKNEHWGGNG